MAGRNIDCAVLVAAGGLQTTFSAAADTDVARGTAVLAARTAASSGDTIYVYASISVAISLAKAGINWVFGAVDVLGTGTNVPLFDDGNTAMSFTVRGMARFATNNARITKTRNASSAFDIECDSAIATGASEPGAYCGNGTVRFVAFSSIQSTNYDAIWCEGGTLDIWTPLSRGGGQAAEISYGGITATIKLRGWIGTATVSGNEEVLRFASGRCELQIDTITAGSGGIALWLVGDDTGGDVEGWLKYSAATGRIITEDHTTSDGTGFVIIGPGTFDSTASASPTLTVGTNTKRWVKDVTLSTKSTETNSIDAASATTLNQLGTLTKNKAVHNVTLNTTMGAKTFNDVAAGTGDFATSANWNPVGVPGPSDDVTTDADVTGSQPLSQNTGGAKSIASMTVTSNGGAFMVLPDITILGAAVFTEAGVFTFYDIQGAMSGVASGLTLVNFTGNSTLPNQSGTSTLTIQGGNGTATNPVSGFSNGSISSTFTGHLTTARNTSLTGSSINALAVLARTGAGKFRVYTRLRTGGVNSPVATVTGGVEQSHAVGSTLAGTYVDECGGTLNQLWINGSQVAGATVSGGAWSGTVPNNVGSAKSVQLKDSTNTVTVNVDTITIAAAAAVNKTNLNTGVSVSL